MSSAISVIAKNAMATQDEVSEIIKNMIVGAKNQVGAVVTNAEMAVVAGVCATYGLNPLVKECAAFLSGGKLQVVVMIDGWYKLVNRHPDFDGVECVENLDQSGNVVSVTCRMYLKSRSRPVVVTEYMAECINKKSPVWAQWPIRMLRHKAYIQCARMAFGFTEFIDDDEASRYEKERDVTPAKEAMDYDALDKTMAACTSIDGLKAIAGSVRQKLELSGQWAAERKTINAMYRKYEAVLAAQPQEVIDEETGEVVIISEEPAKSFVDVDEFGDTRSHIEGELA